MTFDFIGVIYWVYWGFIDFWGGLFLKYAMNKSLDKVFLVVRVNIRVTP